ncbi:hypothetical protein FHT08_002572 [Xanthomonas campestris]|nr:hypothetical protein [Xanthomonas sp. CFBP 8152]NIJ77489.1 hypothetical protein [Xanthomonas sp. CFBP 8151]
MTGGALHAQRCSYAAGTGCNADHGAGSASTQHALADVMRERDHLPQQRPVREI